MKCFADGVSVSSEMEITLSGSPDSGSWTTVGIKKASAQSTPAAAAVPAELPKPTTAAAGQQRASQQALAAARSHPSSVLKAQVGMITPTEGL